MASILSFLAGIFKYASEIRWLVGLLNSAPPARRIALKQAMEAEAKHFAEKNGRPKW
jgi:hypothetical protein